MLDLVLEQLSRGWAAKQGDLARCCLVSRSFLAVARPRLYRLFKFRVGYEQEGVQHSMFEHDGSEVDHGQVLSTSPNLARLVQRVEVDNDPFHPARLEAMPLPLPEAVSVLFEICPNVSELSVGDRFLLPLFYALRRLPVERKPALQTLELDAGDSTFVPQVLEATNLAQLHHLELHARWNESFYVWNPSTLGRRGLRLRTLVLWLFLPDCKRFADQLLATSADTLTSLTLAVDISSMPSFANLTQLRCLRLDVTNGDLGSKSEFLEQFPAHLAQLVRLETLAITPSATAFTLSNIRTLTSSSPSALPASLPTSLVALHLHSPHFHPVDLLALVRSSPQAVNLRQLGREPYRHPLGKRDRKKRPSLPSDEEIDELNEACRARGITVVALMGGKE
ncbi:hypothetical protein JCM8097_002218 [Rhodosporidiobolus ruineniae]